MTARYPYFTEEHEMFRKTVRDFVSKELVPHAEEWNEAEEFPREVFRRMGDLGFLGIRYPEEYGGSDLDYFYTVVFSEELAKCGLAGLAMSVFVQSDMGTGPLNLIGSDEIKRKYLAPAIRGEMIAALGITEPGAGSDVAGMRTTAVRDGDEYVINGTKMFITNGARADFISLAAKTDPRPDTAASACSLRPPTCRVSRSAGSWTRWATGCRTPRKLFSRTTGCPRRTCSARKERVFTRR